MARRKAQATRDRVAADAAAEARLRQADAAAEARLRQGRIDADAADIVAFEAELAYEIARSHASSHTRSERVHAGTHEHAPAEEQRLPIASSSQD